MKLDELETANKLTLKQEAFAMAYAESGNASNAYKAVYDVNETTSNNSINVEASKLRNNPKITRAAGACTSTPFDNY